KNFFISYSLSLKNRYNLTGNVFSQKYRHVRLYTTSDIRQVILYIHKNPKHHLVADWKSYNWSSYQDLEAECYGKNENELLFNLFDNVHDFNIAHDLYIEHNSETKK
ncbi:MAG: hypothetical protein KDC82_03360, partial [Bacteroidetes bacterium]|nr:hypothetical protein [Bacteroidota bacterium]